MSEKPDASFPKALSEADLEAGYRFFGNCKVRLEAILKPHVEQTLKRIGQNVFCLVVHDSSTLSYGSAEGCRVAALGGHLKHNGEPGWPTIARGYEKLHFDAARVASAPIRRERTEL